VSSCSYLAFEVNGRTVTTIEGLGTPENPDAVQAAFARNMAFQCGYCISGQIMAAKALLMENAAPTYDEIAEWMVGNTCRCGCYAAIARAIQEAATAQATAASG
jgi:aerobic-type carbon monoxide dehydrogenase small subunit (CoxS/CutS family)